MISINRVTLSNTHRIGRFISKPALLLSGLIIALSACARADDLTGQPQDDPKDLLPTPVVTPQPTSTSTSLEFAPLPRWARGIVMPPLPDKLKPMGRSTTVASASAPQPLAPPKDSSNTSSTGSTPEVTTTPVKPADNSPTLIAVSPFLQWIKANPQAAAAAARQQAESYHVAPPPHWQWSGAPNAQDDSYWLPPLIDSSDFGNRTVGGSAAIYSTPQR